MRKRGKYWQARPKAGDAHGKWRSTRCTDHKAAQAVLAEWERELADPGYALAKGVSLAQAVDRVNRDYAALVKVGKKAPATQAYYLEKTGVLLFAFGQNAPLAQVAQPQMVDRFVERRRLEEVSEHTIHKELGVLRVVLKRAKREGWWAGDVDAVLPHNFSSGSKPRERYVADLRQLGRIIRGIKTPDIAAQVAFAVATGAEAQAIVRARPSDIQERFVDLHGKKRPTRERSVPIVASWQETLLRFVRRACADSLSEMRNGRRVPGHVLPSVPERADDAMEANRGGPATPPGEPAPVEAAGTAPGGHAERVALFVHTSGLRKALRLACAKAGLPHLSPNDLRRTFNVWLTQGGVPTDLRALAMGHASTKLLDSFTYGKLDADSLRTRMLNTLAACQPAVTDSGGRGRTEPDNSTARSSEMAPRAGFEPATHGLTVRCVRGSYQRGIVRIYGSTVDGVSP